MPLSHPTRRDFLGLCGAFLGSLVAAGVAAAHPRGGAGRLRGRKAFRMYRRSVRGRRTSNALKLDTANKRFLTRGAAESYRLYRGDNARVVELDVSLAELLRLFVGRRRGRLFVSRVVDLRSL